MTVQSAFAAFAFMVVLAVSHGVQATLRAPSSSSSETTASDRCERIFAGPAFEGNPFAGAFCNAIPEFALDTPVPVSYGKIPDWFRGTLFYNVPAQFSVGVDQVQHWFDAFAQINALEVTDEGSLRWRAKLLNNTSVHVMRTVDHRYSYKGAFTYPFPGPLFPASPNGKNGTTPPPHGAVRGSGTNVDVSILELGGRFFAISDMDVFVEFDPVTLETISPEGMPFDGPINGGAPVSLGVTHAVTDERTGEYFNYALDPVPTAMGLNATLKFWRVNRSAPEVFQAGSVWKRELVASFEPQNATYAHSFEASDSFLIWPQNPLKDDAFEDMIGVPPLRALTAYADSVPTRFYVLDRRTFEATVVEVDHPLGLIMHSGNAYDDEADGSTVYDFIAYSEVKMYDYLALGEILGNISNARERLNTGRLTRCRFYIKNTTDPRVVCAAVNSSQISSFPWYNKNYHARRNRYTYLTRVNPASVVKVDMETNETVAEWIHPVSCSGCANATVAEIGIRLVANEAYFVPRHFERPLTDANAGQEDDGLLILTVYDSKDDRTAIVGVNPQTMASEFEVWLPMVMPAHFHGIFCRPGAPGASSKFGPCLWN